MSDSSSAPNVSICVPAYNAERYIGRTIRSVLAQTHRDFELIIVDNASTDRTMDVVAEFSDSRIRVIQNESNIGPLANFNKVLSLAQGRYVKMLSADDVIYPLCLERQVAILDEDREQHIAVVSCARHIIDVDERVILTRRFPRTEEIVDGRRAALITLRSGGNLIGEWHAALLRTDTARQLGGFRDFQYCIDYDLLLRALMRGALYVVAEPLCAYRITPQAWSLNLVHLQTADYRKLLDDMHEQYGVPPTAWGVNVATWRARLNNVIRRMIYKWVLR